MSRHVIITRRRARAWSGGFTLVELLVTVTIIAILATMVLGSLHVARESAREVKTKSTIAKLNRIVMEKYESYRTRRVPISTAGLPPRVVSAFRLRAIRELMRMEMPERFSDITYPGSTDYQTDPLDPADEGLPIVMTYMGISREVYRPALAGTFFRKLLYSPPPDYNYTYASAECLYMWVTIGSPTARGQFQENEIGDADGDGYPEFVDGWGNPIYFLRWAPAFNESDVQPNVIPSHLTGQGLWQSDSEIVGRQRVATEQQHDPFDPRRLDMQDAAGNPSGWELLPLIYSAGPDGIYDINFTSGGTRYYYQGSVYSVNIGEPMDTANTSVTARGPANGSLDHYDNIHNHRKQAD